MQEATEGKPIKSLFWVWVMAAVFLAFAGYCATISRQRFELSSQMDRLGVSVPGIVEKEQFYETTTYRNGAKRVTRHYQAIVRFTDLDGKVHVATLAISEAFERLTHAGQSVVVRYLAGQPDTAELEPGKLGEGRWFMAIMAAVLGAIGGAMMMGLVHITLEERQRRAGPA